MDSQTTEKPGNKDKFVGKLRVGVAAEQAVREIEERDS